MAHLGRENLFEHYGSGGGSDAEAHIAGKDRQYEEGRS
jgi:hypothetical protein